MQPDLESICTQFVAIREDSEKLIEGLDQSLFNWRPSPDRWSIAQCITHLNAVDGLDADLLAASIDRGRRDGLTGSGPFRYGALSSWFIAHLEPPAKFKTKAPGIYVPPPAQDIEVAMNEFRRIHARMLELAASADGLDLARIKVPTPLAKFIKFSLGQRFRLIAAHDRRHLYQAWQVRRELP